jgi:hypothetical protein
MQTQARVDAATLSANGGGSAGATTSAAIETEVEKYYGRGATAPDGVTPMDPAAGAQMAQIHQGIRLSAQAAGYPMSGPQAHEMTRGLFGGTMEVKLSNRPDPNEPGRMLWGVVDKTTGAARGVLGHSAGRRVYDLLLPAGRPSTPARPPTVASPNSSAMPARALN